MLSSARTRAMKKGTEFSITEKDIEVPEVCPVLGIPLRFGTKGDYDLSPSLDRIIPSRGYVPGNVIVMSFRANRLKSDASAEELRAVADFVESVSDD